MRTRWKRSTPPGLGMRTKACKQLMQKRNLHSLAIAIDAKGVREIVDIFRSQPEMDAVAILKIECTTQIHLACFNVMPEAHLLRFDSPVVRLRKVAHEPLRKHSLCVWKSAKYRIHFWREYVGQFHATAFAHQAKLGEPRSQGFHRFVVAAIERRDGMRHASLV
jgi:hypothetical protein